MAMLDRLQSFRPSLRLDKQAGRVGRPRVEEAGDFGGIVSRGLRQHRVGVGYVRFRAGCCERIRSSGRAYRRERVYIGCCASSLPFGRDDGVSEWWSFDQGHAGLDKI